MPAAVSRVPTLVEASGAFPSQLEPPHWQLAVPTPLQPSGNRAGTGHSLDGDGPRSSWMLGLNTRRPAGTAAQPLQQAVWVPPTATQLQGGPSAAAVPLQAAFDSVSAPRGDGAPGDVKSRGTDFSFSRYPPPGQIPNEDAPSLLWTGMDHDPRGAPLPLGDDGVMAPAGLFAGLAAGPI